jgi:hypothetical protein
MEGLKSTSNNNKIARGINPVLNKPVIPLTPRFSAVTRLDLGTQPF